MLIEISSEKKDHAIFSASGSERWLNCPGSILLSKGAPSQGESPFAEEGTEAHSCLEFMLKNIIKEREEIKAEALGRWPKEMVGHCLDATDFILSELMKKDEGELYIETRVDASGFTVPGQFGTLDVAIAEPGGELFCIDLKYGAGITVDVINEDYEANPQLAYYALAMFDKLNGSMGFKSIRLCIIQPRAFDPDDQTIRMVSFPASITKKWRRMFLDGVGRVLSPEPGLNAGKWCRYCPAALYCPELRVKVIESAELEEIPNFSPYMLSEMLEKAEKVEFFIRRLKSFAYHILQTGGMIPGYELKTGKSQRRWRDDKKTAEEAYELFGARAFTEPGLLSPAQLEKKLKNKMVPSKLKKWMSERTVREQTSGKLTRIGAEKVLKPRKSAADVFSTWNG